MRPTRRLPQHDLSTATRQIMGGLPGQRPLYILREALRRLATAGAYLFAVTGFEADAVTAFATASLAAPWLSAVLPT